MMRRKSGLIPAQESLEMTALVIRNLIRWLLIVNFLMITLSILTFSGTFHFWNDALSYLGSTVTPDGRRNTLSPFFFDAGLLISSILMFKMAVLWKDLPGQAGSVVKPALMRIAGTGYFLMIVPCNLFNPAHMLGATFVFGSFWFISVILISEYGKRIGPWKVIFFHLLLQLSVLPYAYTYMILRSSVKQFYQKFAVIGLMIMLELLTKSCLKSEQEESVDIPDWKISG